MSSRIALALATASLALSVALPTWGASSINTTQPANGVPYSPAPIRQNFGFAANDINALFSNSAGNSAPSNPSPGQWWLDTSGVTTYELKIFDGRGNAWLHVATLDTINNIWVPPVGGGLLPTILSAATTNIGSVPQAALYISGSNFIQSLGASAPIGTMKILFFTDGATLVNVPGQLSLPGGSNITQQAGDTAIALQISQGSWQIINDSRSSGVSQTRTILTTTGNLYVATTGNDISNSCASNLAPCQTIQHAVDIAAQTYDLGGQSLLVNVAPGTYSAGAVLSGPLVGAASTATSPSPEFPISGLQIIGNPSNPGAVVIADTSSPPYTPAAFMASNGASYFVSGFTVSSVNGNGIAARAGAVLQSGVMVFGNTGNQHISSNSNSVVNITSSYTISGNAPAHLSSATGGLIRIGPPSPITITLSGSPTFAQAFASLSAGNVNINAGTVTFSGSAIGPKFLVQGSSFLNTNSGSPSYLPGSVPGAILFYSDYNPPIPLGTISGITGLGGAGTAVPDPVIGALDVTGSIQLNPQAGAAATGQVILGFNTFEFRNCAANLTNASGAHWAAGATAIASDGLLETQTTIIWDNNGTPLTAGVSYYLHYACPGMHV